MLWFTIDPERGGIKGDIDGAEVIIPAPTVLVPEHKTDLVRKRLRLEIKVEGGIPDRVQGLADNLCRELVASD